MMPMTLLMIVPTWVALQWQYLGLCRNSGMDPEVKKQKSDSPELMQEAADIVRNTVRERLDQMGRMKWIEIWVLFLFLLLVVLWFTRDPSWGYGWAKAVSSKKISVATPTIAIVLLMFVIPATPAFFKCMSRDDSKRPKKPIPTILTWNIIKVKMMWGILLLMGGGFALAKGFEVSGLSKMIGNGLRDMKSLDPYLVLCISCFIAINFTEFTSNVVVVNILLPVLAQMAIVIKINPLYLMIPVTLCCSFSFMLPMGTPPNAFVVGYAHIATKDLAWMCAYCTLLMAGYWLCEVLPLGVTALFPVFLFPIMGIMGTKDVCSQYFHDTSMMFFASLCVAFAIEASNFHKRIALKLILLIGHSHLKLTLTFMMVTMFLSLWVSNSAACAMMAPVVMAVLNQLEEQNVAAIFRMKLDETEPSASRTTKGYMFGICFASSIGGIGSIFGTPTNLAFKGIFESKFPDGPSIDAVDWMIVMLPMALMITLGTWIILQWQYLGLWRKTGMDPEVKQQKLQSVEKSQEVAAFMKQSVRDKLDEMGKMKWAEIWVLTMFLCLVVLWFTRDPSWGYGWSSAITDKKITDTTPTIAIVIILFAIPESPTIFNCMSRDDAKRPIREIESILTWKIIKLKMMWGLLLLMGGGFALAKGFEVSGLSVIIGEGLKGMESMHPFVVMCIACFCATNLSEFTSNVVVANILLPVLAQMAIVLKVNPLYLLIPVTVCCSFAFMVPVGTPPNAFILGYAHMTTKDLIVSGVGPKILAYIVVISLFPTWGKFIYKISGFPDWADV